MADLFSFTYGQKKEMAVQTAAILTDEIGLGDDAVEACLLVPDVDEGLITPDEVKARYGESVARIIGGLGRIRQLYEKNPVVESENFRNLLISFAEDMRVVLIMIADRVNLMRQMKAFLEESDDQNRHDREAFVNEVSQEAAYLYAPLAHKLGGIKCHIKGRTKSIHSIWEKMKKQKCGFEGIYDLFAIRIIIDCPEDKEKMQCWQAYSIVTDMYQPNPKRLRDWLSVPKSNGYESLHITVLGPDQKWVEVQIRTERMDEIAENGVAAHWRYKGVKGEAGLDDWLAGVRSMLEHADGLEAMDQFKMDLYEDEVFVFTPRGDLFKFPVGATVLDFAYHIHSKLGNQCTGGRINGRVVSIRYLLKSGDQVEILTSSTQKPRQEWLSIVKTSRAKSKIRLALKETQQRDGLFAKEMLERKFKNRKIEQDESVMFHVIRKMGFKEVSDFYKQIADGLIDANAVVDKYIEVREGEKTITGDNVARSASEFELDESKIGGLSTHLSDDVLVIDRDLKGLDYQLARCCTPIYGDPIFGFVTISGGIKIHRMDCPNAPELRRRYGYRVVKARWSGKGSSQYSITLRVVGNDDIGIVNNLTSIISKEEKLFLRSINIDSHDGLFSGNLVVMLEDTSRLEALLKKLRTVKGVKQVERI